MLYPEIFEELLAFQDRLTVWEGGVTPVPVAASVMADGWALLVKVRVALAEPAARGLKVRVKGTLVPAVIIAGSDKPLTAKPELLLLTAVTVTLAPLALKLPEAVPLNPTKTSPAAKVAGDALN